MISSTRTLFQAFGCCYGVTLPGNGYKVVNDIAMGELCPISTCNSGDSRMPCTTTGLLVWWACSTAVSLICLWTAGLFMTHDMIYIQYCHTAELWLELGMLTLSIGYRNAHWESSKHIWQQRLLARSGRPRCSEDLQKVLKLSISFVTVLPIITFGKISLNYLVVSKELSSISLSVTKRLQLLAYGGRMSIEHIFCVCS